MLQLSDLRLATMALNGQTRCTISCFKRVAVSRVPKGTNVEGLNLRAVTFFHPGVKMLWITCWTALPVLRIFSDLPRHGILLDLQGFEYFRTALPAL